MRAMLWVGLGSGLGGGLRCLVDALFVGLLGAAPFLGTLLVNLGGSLLVGYLAGCWATAGCVPPAAGKWAFWVTGFCGGFTTFSAFTWQVQELLEAGEGTLAGAYAAGSLGLGLIAVHLGLSWAFKERRTAD